MREEEGRDRRTDERMKGGRGEEARDRQTTDGQTDEQKEGGGRREGQKDNRQTNGWVDRGREGGRAGVEGAGCRERGRGGE